MRSIFRLVLPLLLLPAAGWAEPVDPNAINQVASICRVGNDDVFVLRTNGEVWHYSDPNAESGVGWQLVTPATFGYLTPPVPVSEIANWSAFDLWTHSGVYWRHIRFGASGDWYVVAFPPPQWGAVQERQKSLGSAKQGYR